MLLDALRWGVALHSREGRCKAAKGRDEEVFLENKGRVYPPREYENQGYAGADSVKCGVCGWGMHKNELKFFLNTSRSGTPYKGEPDFGHCGNLACASEGQARLDMEAINGCLDTIPELWQLSGPQIVAMYHKAPAPTFTAAQTIKKMKKAAIMFEEKCAEINYDQAWYDNHWQ